MNKFINKLCDVIGYTTIALFVLVSLTVPTAIVIWAIRWILSMLGVIVV